MMDDGEDLLVVSALLREEMNKLNSKNAQIGLEKLNEFLPGDHSKDEKIRRCEEVMRLVTISGNVQEITERNLDSFYL